MTSLKPPRCQLFEVAQREKAKVHGEASISTRQGWARVVVELINSSACVMRLVARIAPRCPARSGRTFLPGWSVIGQSPRGNSRRDHRHHHRGQWDRSPDGPLPSKILRCNARPRAVTAHRGKIHRDRSLHAVVPLAKCCTTDKPKRD